MRPAFIVSTLALGVAVTLSGCWMKPQQTYEHEDTRRQLAKLPFEFRVSAFKDERPEDTRLADSIMNRETYPFVSELFVENFTSAFNLESKTLTRADLLHRSFEDKQQIGLDIELLDYASVVNGREHTISFYVNMKGYAKNGEEVGEGRFSCLANNTRRFNLRGAVGEVWDDGEFTSSNQKVKIWETLYKQCTEDLTYQFGRHVLAWHRRNANK